MGLPLFVRATFGQQHRDGGGGAHLGDTGAAWGPLWLCATGILVIVLNNRRLRKRHGDIHAIGVSDVFARRGSPVAWNEDLGQVIDARLRTAGPEEQKTLHRLGEGFPIATLATANGDTLAVAGPQAPSTRSALLGPFEARTPNSL